MGKSFPVTAGAVECVPLPTSSSGHSTGCSVLHLENRIRVGNPFPKYPEATAPQPQQCCVKRLPWYQMVWPRSTRQALEGVCVWAAPLSQSLCVQLPACGLRLVTS